MKPMHLLSMFALILLFVMVLIPGTSLAEEDENESVAEIVERSNMAPKLQETVVELFEHLHRLENSFRDEQWGKASREVDQVDLFYNKVLQLSEELNSKVELSVLQAFEFSLAEVARGIKRQDRQLVERRFLELQPEIFDILDQFTAIPLRLTASRFYIDLAIIGLERQRFDIALDELGEICEYMEQLKPSFTAGDLDLDLDALEQQLANAHRLLKKQDPDSVQVLKEIRQTLEQYYQVFSSR